MTVNELISVLSNLAPDLRELDVCVDSACGEYGFQDIEIVGHHRHTRFQPEEIICLTNDISASSYIRVLHQK